MKKRFRNFDKNFPVFVKAFNTLLYTAVTFGAAYLVAKWCGAGISAVGAKILPIVAVTTVGVIGITNQILLLTNVIKNKEDVEEAIKKAEWTVRDVSRGNREIDGVSFPKLKEENKKKEEYIKEISASVTKDDSDKNFETQKNDNKETFITGAVTSHELEEIIKSFPSGTPDSVKTALNSSNEVIIELSKRIIETEKITESTLKIVEDVKNKTRSI